jgi:hypothetical protein
MRLAGVAVGTAALGAILQAGVKHTLHGASHVTAATVSAGQVHAAKGVSASTAGHAFSVGLHWIFVISAVWIALGSLACFVFVGRMRQTAPPVPQTAAQPASS